MEMYGTIWALLPSAVTLLCALLTHEVYISLFAGILSGAILLAIGSGNIFYVFDYLLYKEITPGDADSAVGIVAMLSYHECVGVLIFLVLIGVAISIIEQSGGAHAFGTWIRNHAKSRKTVGIITALLGMLIFIDDYFNCMTVGAAMRPACDSKRISRAKLSYIIDSTAAPVCMLVPISSWGASLGMVDDYLEEGINSMQLFLASIPFNFYSLLTLVFVLALCFTGIDYGPMAKAEYKALNENDLGVLRKESRVINKNARSEDMIVPLVFLVLSCTVGLLWNGGFWDPSTSSYGDILVAMSVTNLATALPWGAFLGLTVIIIYFFCRRILSPKQVSVSFVLGIRTMAPGIIILALALTLRAMGLGLGIDEFISAIFSNTTPKIIMLMPALIFLVSAGCAFATGTSWGTFGIMLPIAFGIVAGGSDEVIIPGMAACLAGCVCGDHMSPISDTTIMSSAGANVDHLTHVRTQLPYALTVAGVSLVCYIIVGFLPNPFICLIIGCFLLALILCFMLASKIRNNEGENDSLIKGALVGIIGGSSDDLLWTKVIEAADELNNETSSK